MSVEIDSGCIYISGAVEFDDRPGPVRDALASMVRTWHRALERAIRIAVDEGHLRADTDPTQMLFEIHGLILALHHDARFLRHPGADAARACAASSASLADNLPAQPRRRVARRTRRRTEYLPIASPGAPRCRPYTPPLRDMQFVLHELLDVTDELKALPAHAEIDVDTINAVLEEGGKFAAEVIAPAQHQSATPRAARSTSRRTR